MEALVKKVINSPRLQVAGAIMRDYLEKEGHVTWKTLLTMAKRNRPACIGVVDEGEVFYKKRIDPAECGPCILYTDGYCRAGVDRASDSGYNPNARVDGGPVFRSPIYLAEDWRRDPVIPGKRLG